jgi:multisubunit Na+/H+ antiporter MnhB subunit
MTLMTQAVARLLLLPTFATAVAVLVKGYSDTGDGFAAGVIAAMGMLMQFVAFGYRPLRKLGAVRYAPWLAALGLSIALLVAFIPPLFGEEVLTHFPRAGTEALHLGTLELHTAVLFDIGMFLLVYGFAVQAMSLIAHATVRLRR